MLYPYCQIFLINNKLLFVHVIKEETISFTLLYIYTGHYNHSVRIINLVSHTTYVVCVNFIHQWRDLQFKVESEQLVFFEKLFVAILFC